jgi:hypothetical protein
MIWGMLSLGRGFYSRGGYYPPEFNKLKPVHGIIVKKDLGRSWGIAITDNITGKKYTCNGYPLANIDFNKPAKILVGNNRIYQIEVSDKIKLSYYNRINGDESSIFNGFKNAFIGIALLILGVVLKNNMRRNI